jgi:hypothetical protein
MLHTSIFIYTSKAELHDGLLRGLSEGKGGGSCRPGGPARLVVALVRALAKQAYGSPLSLWPLADPPGGLVQYVHVPVITTPSAQTERYMYKNYF